MKQLNPALVKTIQKALNGKRLEKFNSSIAILNVSLAQGAWVKRGSVKANSGFYQGLFGNGYGHEADYRKPGSDSENSLDMCLCFGHAYQGKQDLEKAYKGWCSRAFRHLDIEKVPKKLAEMPFALVKTWVELCGEKAEAFKFLHDARPKPVLTKILLSPKVTKTLKEMNLDIDLPSVKMPKIVVDFVKKFIDDKGKEQTIKFYRIEWEKGIKHGQSRFADGGGCAACGKTIPSGLFVPVEAIDKKRGGYVSFWLGCDCARNIFGVKDIGLDKTKVVK